MTDKLPTATDMHESHIGDGVPNRTASPLRPETSMEDHPAWPMISRLPTRLRAMIPMNAFTVRNLIELRPGATVESAWPATEDVPLRAGQTQISWSEFEVVEERMALRVTRLA